MPSYGLKIILIYLTSIINSNYSIPLSSFHNTTKWNEFFSLKGTTFVYVLSSNNPLIAYFLLWPNVKNFSLLISVVNDHQKEIGLNSNAEI